MRRPAPDESAAYYQTYTSLVPEEDVLAVLEENLTETTRFLESIGEARSGHRYAPGKWSIKDIIGHLVDGERIFGTRALCFSRGETAELPGFDQDAYVSQAGFDRIPLHDLLEELALLRRANLRLFRNLPEEAWDRWGTANHALVTVRALAFIIAGHERHHRRVISERYL